MLVALSHFGVDDHLRGIPLVKNAYLFVDFFFVLSGFLVGGLLFGELQRNGRIDYPRFFARRLFKIWPAYFLYLAEPPHRRAPLKPADIDLALGS